MNTLSINEEEILAALKNRYPNKDLSFYEEKLNYEKNLINQNLPLTINIVRDFEESKELLAIESIEDSEGNEKPIRYLKFSFQTLDDKRGYWLDTCEFLLNVNN